VIAETTYVENSNECGVGNEIMRQKYVEEIINMCIQRDDKVKGDLTVSHRVIGAVGLDAEVALEGRAGQPEGMSRDAPMR